MKYDDIAKAYAEMHHQRVCTELYEEVLQENRIDWLKKQYPTINTAHDSFAKHRESGDIVDFLANEVDPSKNKKYTQWLVNRYSRGGFRQEDADRVQRALVNFTTHRNKLPEDLRDIGKFNTVASLVNAVAPHVGTANTKAERIMGKEEIPGLDKEYEDDQIKIHHVKTKAASQKVFADSTTWCTASKSEDRNMFDHYNKMGPLHVITRKRDGALFQYHVNSGQFMDKDDEEISDKDMAEIKPSLSKAWATNPNLLK